MKYDELREKATQEFPSEGVALVLPEYVDALQRHRNKHFDQMRKALRRATTVLHGLAMKHDVLPERILAEYQNCIAELKAVDEVEI